MKKLILILIVILLFCTSVPARAQYIYQNGNYYPIQPQKKQKGFFNNLKNLFLPQGSPYYSNGYYPNPYGGFQGGYPNLNAFNQFGNSPQINTNGFGTPTNNQDLFFQQGFAPDVNEPSSEGGNGESSSDNSGSLELNN